MNRKILVGGAWPYANGSLHIGHIAGLLPGDVIARYHRACKDEVYYVSGSDCHGTPVAIRAKAEGKSPREISDRYHEEFCLTRTIRTGFRIFIRNFTRVHMSMRRKRPRLIVSTAAAFLRTDL